MGTVNKTMMSGGGSDFTPCPKGIYQAVLCDVVDLGYLEKIYNGESKGWKPTVQLVFQVKKLREEDNKPYLIFGRREVLSFDDRANFHKDLSLMLGAERLAELMEMEDWDTDMLIGTNCRMQVVHNQSNDGSRTYANIGAMFPWVESEDGPLLAVRDYTRRCDRDDWAEPTPSAFDDPALAQRLIAERAGQQTLSDESEHPNVTAAANLGKPTPAAPQMPQRPQNTVPATPIKASQMDAIVAQAKVSYGEDYKPAMNKYVAEKYDGRTVNKLTSDEAAQLIDALRNMKPHPKVLDDPEVSAEDYNPFADEGEPGYRPPAVDPAQGNLMETPQAVGAGAYGTI